MLKKPIIALLLSTSILANNPTSQQIELLQQQINQLQAQLLKIKQAQGKPNKLNKKSKNTSTAKRTFRRQHKSQPYKKPVTTSAVWGVISEYDGSDLIVSYSSMYQDLMILKQRQKDNWKDTNISDNPSIQLSGAIETQGIVANNAANNSRDINLSRFELDILSTINSWVSAIASINYKDEATAELDRVKNSPLYLKRAFITVGKLDKMNTYATVGQLFMPFGRYSSLMLTNPMTVSLGRATGRGAIIGYYNVDEKDSGINGSIYLMQAKTSKFNEENKLNSFGINANWSNNLNNNSHLQIGSSWTQNITDSDHVRDILHNDSSKNKLQKNVNGLNTYAILGIHDWRFSTEYTTALNNITTDSKNYNRPIALHVEIDKAFGVKSFPSNLFVTFDKSWQSQELSMPRQSWSFGAYTHFWKNTLQAIEFRHNNAYNENYADINKNMITLQFGIYF